ncbi:PAS domain-containing protein [Flavobacterium psychrotrophum]|uniref:PAS domain-containing protein n=1 Tax=Flavobacterium psychrotrophum TaxID=2294119 RepID=UPI000E310714|nr:PAS domain-containing protein [Flavobacterium psychrotrophum]
MGKDDLHKMMALDIYLSSLSDEAYHNVMKQMKESGSRFPVMSWDISGEAYRQTILNAKKQADAAKLDQLATKYNWSYNPVQLLHQSYDALVVTDTALKILWVNPGFADMTGYTAKEALGNTPKFLQGANTLETSRREIRRRLDEGEPFRAVITNYRKNKDEYLCEVKIYPLTGPNGRTTHFIALEQETA